MQKKDGTEREYFYGYKLSGGSSQPGIKQFVAENMLSRIYKKHTYHRIYYKTLLKNLKKSKRHLVNPGFLFK